MTLCTGDIFMAERLADLMANYDYALIDGTTVVELAASLRDFLHSKGLQTHPDGAAKYVRETGIVLPTP